MNDINERINLWLDLLFQMGVAALVLATIFLFGNWTTEFYETPKLLFLLLATSFLLVIWVLRCAVAGRVTITRTPLDIPFLLLLVVFIISTFFAPARWVAILGQIPRVHGALTAFTIYILLYFILSSNLKHLKEAKQIIYLLLTSGIILSLVSLLYYAGIILLPFAWTTALNFTPTGSSFSTTAILALLLPFPLLAILQDKEEDFLGKIPKFPVDFPVDKIIYKVALALILALFTTTIVLTGNWATILAAAASVGLALFITPAKLAQKNIPYIALPVVLALLLLFLSFTPLGSSQNSFYTKAQNFPRQLQLPLTISWKISVSAFRDSPFWGSGPGSYQADFTNYKPLEFNNLKFWTTRFDQAFNDYLQLLATLGGPGLLALILLTTVFISLSFKVLLSSQSLFGSSSALSGIIFFILLALHPSTLPLWVVGILILAIFMVVHRNMTQEMQVGLTATSAQNNQNNLNLRFDALPGMMLMIILILVGAGLYFAGKFALADYHHRQALNAVSLGQGLEAYNELVAAESLNPNIDLYRTDLAQTNFALANAIALAKGPTESSPSGSLTDQDKQNIQTLLSQAIAEGRAATVLNPNSAANWEILASIYRQISGVAQNALAFSLDAYGQAISHDPLNPVLRLTVGGIYYSVKNFDLAIRFFTDAINIKPDYANAYYNLAIALSEKGDLAAATSIAEKAVSLLDPTSDDYQTASTLLADLKSRLESSASGQLKVQKETPTPASENKLKSALEDKKLPTVLKLPQPEKISTPEAIKQQNQE